jgi:acyl-CoA synthetase (AMP-forming)/AMP-acid ligase II
MTKLAETFGAPVIEGYGMTEAAHQMCSNPLPPRAQKPGAVGVPRAPKCASPHEASRRLGNEAVGEIVISGPNVTPGYEGNPEANAKNFFEAEGKRWFRTGDQGAFDEEGYLTLTGRLKEIINRGGEKVSPLEVDGVLWITPPWRRRDLRPAASQAGRGGGRGRRAARGARRPSATSAISPPSGWPTSRCRARW